MAERRVKILATPRKNYQLLLARATPFLSTKTQSMIQGILCRAVDDAYDRGKQDQSAVEEKSGRMEASEE
jgi:hypothetical protein